MPGRNGRALRTARLAALVLLMILVTASTSGCWDHRELEDVGFILALGLDKGENAPVRLTAQIAVPVQIAPGRGGGGGPGVITETVEGSTIDEIMTYMSSFRHKQVSLQHNKIIVFGKELAQEGILQFLGEAVRDREIRRSNYLLVSTGTAGDVLQALSAERNPAAAIEELVRLTSYTGLAPQVTIHDWLTAYESRTGAPVAPVIGPPRSPTKSGLEQDGGSGRGTGSGVTGNGALSLPKLQVMGTAVFDGDRLVDMMSGVESQVFLMMIGKLKRTAITTPLEDPQAVVTVRLKGEKPKKSLTYEGSTPKIKHTIVFEGGITQFIYRHKYLTTQRELDNVARQVGERVKGIAEELVARMQGLGVDPFGYAGLARGRMSTYTEWVGFDWRPLYQQADIAIEVKSFLRRTGLTIQPLQVNPVGDGQEGGSTGP